MKIMFTSIINFFKRLFGGESSIQIATTHQIQELLDKSWIAEESNELFDGTYAEYYQISSGTFNDEEYIPLTKEK